MKQIFFVALFALSYSFVCSEPVQIDINTCGKGFEDLKCTVDQVKVDHCQIDRSTKACRLKRGSNYTMRVDFTPDFEGDDVTMMAYALLPGIDAEFQGMDDNACHWMSCPVVKDTAQTYIFNLSMQKSYPKGSFNVRWLMKKAGQPACCFINRFKIE